MNHIDGESFMVRTITQANPAAPTWLKRNDGHGDYRPSMATEGPTSQFVP